MLLNRKKLLHIRSILIFSLIVLGVFQLSPILSAESLIWMSTGTVYASFTYTPLMLHVNDTVTFDASASTSEKGSIISYEWDYGDGTNGTGMITDKTYTEAGNYTVTLTVTDNEGAQDFTSKLIPVIPDPEGPAIDLYNQRDGQGPNEPSEDFELGEMVELTVLLTYYGEPVEYKLVAFEVRNAIGEIVLDRSDLTDANGLARINFTIRGGCLPEIFGTWTALAVASVSGQTVSDTLTFKVTGPYLDLYTQKPEPYSGRGPNQPSDAFAPQEEVILHAEVHYNCEPVEYKFVAFEVKDPTGETVIDRSSATDQHGLATTRFRLASNATFGIYTVLATVEVVEKTVNDTLTFRVGWIIEIIKVETVDATGMAKDIFTKGEHICFNLTAKTMAFVSKTAMFTIVVYDEEGVPIGHVVLSNWVIPPDTSNFFIVDLQIPTWAYIGVATAYANAYTNVPTSGGVPYCPEISITLLVTKS